MSAPVHPSMSPKGVEHLVESIEASDILACIHQCRRKALSTSLRRGTTDSERPVHPSMSPKGVEHIQDW